MIEEKETEGLLQLKIIENSTGKSHYLPFDEPTYTAYVGLNLDFDTEVCVMVTLRLPRQVLPMNII